MIKTWLNPNSRSNLKHYEISGSQSEELHWNMRNPWE
jgi:hypothetical protein